MLNIASPNTIPGIEDRRAAGAFSAFITEDKAPQGFPSPLWNAMQTRYYEYWRWFRGDVFNESDSKDDDGNPVYIYPLAINTVRNFARKHAAILFGEVPDSPVPLVRTLVSPKKPLNNKEYSEADLNSARNAEGILNEVWMSSDGRAIQWEAGVLSQVLGGAVFQVCFDPWAGSEIEEKLIPITVKMWPADFILPVWDSSRFWNLLECYLVYRITSREAELRYGVPSLGATGFCWYIEHWKRDTVSIYINQTPVTLDVNGVPTLFKDVENPFGMVPFVYIPHQREGNFYGSSIVEDLRGLVKEYNFQMANMGDAIKETVERRRYMSNTTQPRVEWIGDDLKVINLGVSPPNAEYPPKVESEDPPTMSEGLVNFPTSLWNQILRDGAVSATSFGEDEGSQRSALTLAFRMWPATSHARVERTFWDVGLSKISRMILRICAVIGLDIDGYTVPLDFNKRYQFSQDWNPQIPRDREQEVNEMVLRKQANLISVRRALERLGDTRNVDEEIEHIKEDMEFQASLQIKAEPANTSIQEPVADSGLKDK